MARKINKEGTRLFKQGGRQDIYTPVVSTIKKNILVALNKSSVLTAADVVKFENGELGQSEDHVAVADADPDAGRVVSDDE